MTDAKYTFSLDLQNSARVYLILHGIRSGILAQRKCLPNKPRMVSDKIAPPAPFIFPSPEGWSKWIMGFKRYRISTELNKKAEILQINTTIYCTNDEADDIFESFTFAEGEEKYGKVKKKCNKHFIIKRNVTLEPTKFNMKKQEPGALVDTYITDFYCLPEHCEFGAPRGELI